MLRLFNLVAVILVSLVAVGYVRGWFDVSRPGSDEYSVTLDRERIGEDTQAARDIASKLGKRIAGRRVTGDVKYVNPLTLSLVILDSDDEELSFKLGGHSRITRGGETAGLMDIVEMSRVAITFTVEDEDGDKKIEEIEILE